MKTIVQLAASRLSLQLRNDLNQVCPHMGHGPLNYDCELDLNDPRISEIERLLSVHGYSRWSGIGDKDQKTEYRVAYIRVYEESDWDAAEYLEIRPETRVGRLGTSKEGRVQLPGLDLRPAEIAVATAFFRQIVMPERWKQKLEQQGQIGVEFLQAEIRANRTEDAEMVLRMADEDVPPYSGEAWWELRSSIELPPVSSTMTLVDPKERKIERGTERWVFRRDLPYNHAELHYRRNDVRNFPDFDLARTWEEWGGQPALVASKRFYHACRDLGLNMGWVPVRIDEG